MGYKVLLVGDDGRIIYMSNFQELRNSLITMAGELYIC